MGLETWQTMRATWKAAREQHKISSGAVSGVNLGDAIDKVKVATTTSLSAVVTATGNLKTAITKYKDGIKKKCPKLAEWLTNNLEKSNDSLKKKSEDSIKMLNGLKSHMATAFSELGKLPDGSEFGNATRRADKENTKWRDEAKVPLARLVACSVTYAKWATTMKAVSATTPLIITGKTSPMVVAREFSEVLTDWASVLKLMATANAQHDWTRVVLASAPTHQSVLNWSKSVTDAVIAQGV